jgi:hypothetical protein
MRSENLSAISQTMGHSTTKTTEENYGRIRSDRAIGDIEKEWMKGQRDQDVAARVQKEPDADLTGYA